MNKTLAKAVKELLRIRRNGLDPSKKLALVLEFAAQCVITHYVELRETTFTARELLPIMTKHRSRWFVDRTNQCKYLASVTAAQDMRTAMEEIGVDYISTRAMQYAMRYNITTVNPFVAFLYQISETKFLDGRSCCGWLRYFFCNDDFEVATLFEFSTSFEYETLKKQWSVALEKVKQDPKFDFAFTEQHKDTILSDDFARECQDSDSDFGSGECSETSNDDSEPDRDPNDNTGEPKDNTGEPDKERNDNTGEHNDNTGERNTDDDSEKAFGEPSELSDNDNEEDEEYEEYEEDEDSH